MALSGVRGPCFKRGTASLAVLKLKQLVARPILSG